MPTQEPRPQDSVTRRGQDKTMVEMTLDALLRVNGPRHGRVLVSGIDKQASVSCPLPGPFHH